MTHEIFLRTFDSVLLTLNIYLFNIQLKLLEKIEKKKEASKRNAITL
jgi:hypothetical protein